MQTARYFGDVYDAGSQSKNHRWGNKNLANLYKGRLRLDAFINRTVVMKDGDLIDGRFFLDFASQSLTHELPLGRMQFAFRDKDLQATILRSFRSSGSAFLKPMLLDSISEPAAKRVMDQLSRYPSDKLRDWRQLPKLFLSFGAQKGEIDRLEAGWRNLIELDKRRKLQTQPWPADFNFRHSFLKLLRRRQRALFEALNTGAGREIAREIAGNLSDARSEFISRIRSERDTNSDGAVLNDIATIETWYHSAYNQTAAEQHGCDVREITDVPGSAAISKNQKLYDKIVSSGDHLKKPIYFGYPRDFVRVLGLIEPEVFDELLRQQSKNLQLWYDQADPNGLRRALDALVELLEKRFGLRDHAVGERFAPTMSLFTTTLGAALGGLMAYELNKRSFLTGGAKVALGAATGSFIGKSVEMGGELFAKEKTMARSIVERTIVIRRG